MRPVRGPCALPTDERDRAVVPGCRLAGLVTPAYPRLDDEETGQAIWVCDPPTQGREAAWAGLVHLDA